MSVVAVVAVAVVLVFVVGVFEDEGRPDVTEGVRELVFQESQLPSGYELEESPIQGCRETPPGMTDCEAEQFRRRRGDRDLDETLGSVAASFTDTAAPPGT